MGYVYRGTRTDDPEPALMQRPGESDQQFRKRRNAASYRERNRERIRVQQREWHARNKDRVNAKARAKYAAQKLVGEVA